MKKVLFILSFITASLTVNAQDPMIDAGEDQIICPPDCVTITAVFEGGGGNTSDYTVEDIDYAPEPYAGTVIPLGDDGTSGSLPIGFDFCFYGGTYSEFYVSPNGWLGFQTGPGTFNPVAIPSVAASVPKNCVMGPWQDMDPGDGGSVRYQTVGVFPSRKLIVTWEVVPYFSCWADLMATQQIILYEGSNNVENHIENKFVCDDWVGGRAVQGVHDETGINAVVNPGRNNTVWTANDEAIRYVPFGAPDVEWYDEDDVLIGMGPEITLCPDETTTYTVRLVSCGTEIASDDVLVTVVCCEAPVMSHTDVTCFGACDGTGTADPMGLPPFTFLWDAAAGGQTTATAVGLCPGDYTVQVFDAAGCIEEGTVTVAEPDELTFTTVLTHVTCFGGSDGGIAVTATGGTPPYTYDIGAGPVLASDFVGLMAGDYTVTVVDANGCSFEADVVITENPLVAVDFIVDYNDGCEPLTVVFTNIGTTGVTNEWNFGDAMSSSDVGTATHIYETFGVYSVSLTVTDADGCTATKLVNDMISVYEMPVADFKANPVKVSTDNPRVEFTDYSTNADSWHWNFAGFGEDVVQNPVFAFPEVEGTHQVILTVTSPDGCVDEVTKSVTIIQERLIFAPNAITPDGDVFNEVFTPYLVGIDVYDYHLTIFNRWGEIIFESYDVTKGWNGTFGGEVVEQGTYIWSIIAADVITDEIHEFNGHVTVLK